MSGACQSRRRPGCAALRAVFDEPLVATAPERAASWLLVEHPGPWPATGQPDDLPSAAAAVLDAASGPGIRPQPIRRVRGRGRDVSTVVLVSCRPRNRWTERRTVRDLRELGDLDVAALAAGQRPEFGCLADEPVVLVYTHGRRDVCCARLGRPLAVLLDAQLPGLVWETTHVGGDRFSPNVVALPGGSYHGALTAQDVPALARAVITGRVLLLRRRGLAGVAAAPQAADHFVRQCTGEARLGAVRILTVTPCPAGQTCVEVLANDSRWCVHVARVLGTHKRLTSPSCAGDGTQSTPVASELVGMSELA